MAIKILKSEFAYSVPKLSLMLDFGDEMAVLGRSNSGKSSLINALCQKKDLARTSKTPGRTRHAVVYELLMARSLEKRPVTLVDLPGFGFASMSKVEAAECEKLIFSYLQGRENLTLILLLLDIRRLPDEREKQIIAIAQERGIKLCLILTKSDKLSLSAQKPAMIKINAELGLNAKSLFLHSTHDEKLSKNLQELVFDHFLLV